MRYRARRQSKRLCGASPTSSRPRSTAGPSRPPGAGARDRRPARRAWAMPSSATASPASTTPAASSASHPRRRRCSTLRMGTPSQRHGAHHRPGPARHRPLTTGPSPHHPGVVGLLRRADGRRGDRNRRDRGNLTPTTPVTSTDVTSWQARDGIMMERGHGTKQTRTQERQYASPPRSHCLPRLGEAQ